MNRLRIFFSRNFSGIIQIFLKEWKSFFSGNLSLILLGLTGFLAGLISVLLGISQGATYEDVTRALFYLFYILSVSIGLLLSSHSFVNEEKNGTMELLRTLPLDLHEIVIGKFLVAVLLFLVLIPVLNIVYVWIISEAPFYVVLTGTIGLFLVSLYGYSVGLFSSSLSESYPISLFIGAAILLAIDIGSYLGGMLPAPFSQIVAHFHALNQFSSFSRGVLTLEGSVFFLSLTILFLFLTVRSLDLKHWRAGK